MPGPTNTLLQKTSRYTKVDLALQGMAVRHKLVADVVESLLGVAYLTAGMGYATKCLARWQLLPASEDPQPAPASPPTAPVKVNEAAVRSAHRACVLGV